MKFTFKTERELGRWSAFYPPHHYIKFKKIQVGNIDSKIPHNIRLKIDKMDINEDGNPNCSWRWITLKKQSGSLQTAKDWLNEHIEEIMIKYKLHIED